MTVPRRTFLSHFLLCLAVAGAAFFAWKNAVFAMIWANDLSMMTSAIGALFVGTAMWLGWQAWRQDDFASATIRSDRPQYEGDSGFGHLAALLSPALGMLGTTIGLSMQAKSLAGGATSFVALATSLYSTGCGVAAYILIMLLTFNLEQGIRRARR